MILEKVCLRIDLKLLKDFISYHLRILHYLRVLLLAL